MQRLLLGISVFFITFLGYGADEKKYQVNLYQSPDTGANVLQKITPGQKLIPIFHRKDWVKVANPQNGDVGWINLNQYQEAQDNYFQPQIQTFFLRKEKDEQGKSTVNVVAYRDGKKLTGKEAKELYEQMSKQQTAQLQHLHNVFWNLNHAFDWPVIHFEPNESSGLNSGGEIAPVVVQPVVIIGPK